MDELELLFVSLGIFVLVFFAIGFLLFILSALGLMGIAKQNNISNRWMAWIPVFNVYLFGNVAYGKKYGWLLIILLFVTGLNGQEFNGELISFPPFIYFVLSASTLLFVLAALYKLYSKMSDKAILMFIFTILSLGLLSPIFLFAIRKNGVISY